MIIVVDVNILLSALIRDSTTREIIVKSEHDFCFPEPSLQKIGKYKQLILEKSGFSELEFLAIWHTLLRFVQTIPTEEIMPHWEKAKKIMERIDPEDVTIISCALSQEEAMIWSNDKHFDKQNENFLIILFSNYEKISK